MLADKPTLRPAYILALIAGILLVLSTPDFPFPEGVRTLLLISGGITFLFAGSAWVEWFVSVMGDFIRSLDINDAKARTEEAKARQYEHIRFMDYIGREVVYNVSGLKEIPSPEMMEIGGEEFPKNTIVEIGKSAVGDNLRNERDWHENQSTVRQAYDALEREKIIRKGNRSGGPEITDRRRFELIMQKARTAISQ